MKFSVVFVAAAALLCSHLVAGEEATEIGEVKGMPLVFNGPATFRQEHLVKGQALTHSRTDSTSYAVPDPANPYIKVKGTGELATATTPSTGIVGVAFSATSSEETSSSSSSSSSSAWTTPLAVGGCAVAAVGIAGFVVMKKRQQRQEEEENDARTPATQSPHNELVRYDTDMETPV